MAKQSAQSRRWLAEHFSDPYVKEAQQKGYRSRAVFKLQELHEKYRLFKPGMVVLDLGAAPGGWSQVLVGWVRPQGQVIALDILPMDPIKEVTFLQGDFREESVLEALKDLLAENNHKSVDWVVSDMAPNLSGNDSIDIPCAMYLAELALDFAQGCLAKNGGFLVKVFQGDGFDAFIKQLKAGFAKVVIRKPKASRDRSREIYVLATDFKGSD